MKNLCKIAGLSSLMLVALALSSFAQWGYGPVVVFDGKNGGGTASSFGVGEFRNGSGEFGTLRNDSARSVTVPTGYRVRFCENEGSRGEGSGRCEEVTEGNHNLQYGGTASYIRVFGPRSGGNWGSGWNGGGQRGVVLYEDANSTGRSQEFGVGRYLNMTGALGNVRNDKASSVVVQRGFRVRLCEDEGNMGIGAGRCEEYGDGRYNLRYNDSASYIEVARAGWGGGWNGGGWSGGGNDGGWNGNNGGSNGGWNGNNNGNSGGWGGNRDRGVMVYIDPDQRGTGQLFDVGTFRNDQGLMSQIGNDTASSVWVANGYHVQLCENEPKGFYGSSGTGKCEEYGPGRYNLRYNDKASYIRVWRDR